MNSPEPADIFTALPGGESVSRGLRELQAGEVTVDSCLAAIASPRLVQAGLLSETISLGEIDTEHTLYQLLGETEADPYAAYRSRLNEISSFQNALDHRLRWQAGLPA